MQELHQLYLWYIFKEVGLVQKFNDSILGPLKLIGIRKIGTKIPVRNKLNEEKKNKTTKTMHTSVKCTFTNTGHL